MARPFFGAVLLVLLPALRLSAQQPDSVAGVRRLRLRDDTVRLALPPELEDAGRLAGSRAGAAAVARAWADAVRSRIGRRAALRWNAPLMGADTAAEAAGAATSAAPPIPAAGETGSRLPTMLRQYADLNLQMNARFEMRFDQLRNLRCTPGEANQLGSGCRGGFTPPRFDPQFNVRGVETSRQPLKVVVDSRLELPLQAKLLRDGGVLVVTASSDADKSAALRQQGAEILRLPAADGRVDLPALLEELGRRGINELHVEGGFRLNGALLAAGLVDELLFYLAPCLVGNAARGMFDLPPLESLQDKHRLVIRDVRMVGADLRVCARLLANE